VLALFAAYRMIATPLSPVWQPELVARTAAPAPSPKEIVSGSTGRNFKAASGRLIGSRDAGSLKELKDDLAAAGVPFTIVVASNGKELISVDEAHQEALMKVLSERQGPPLPVDYHVCMPHDPRLRTEFGEWMTRKGVKWHAGDKRRQECLIWEPGPAHTRLFDTFRAESRVRWLGIDYYAIEAAGGRREAARIAAFDAPRYTDAFLRWLDYRDVTPRFVEIDGRRFVTWSEPQNLLQLYVDEMRASCLKDARSRSEGLPPGVLEARC
jgi:hypothetical protein